MPRKIKKPVVGEDVESSGEQTRRVIRGDQTVDDAFADQTQEDIKSPFADTSAAKKRKPKSSRLSATKPPPPPPEAGTGEEPIPDLPFSTAGASDDADSVRTVVLDSKQHDELMALRAQQDAALKERFEKNVAVMFTDLVGSTAYYEKFGDLKGREKVLTHNALLFPLIQNAGGVIIKTIGDAIMAGFDSVDDALAVSAAMQHTLAEHNQDIVGADDEIHIRIALNSGVAITQDGDLHGDVVNVASRIEHEAAADEILVSEAVHREGGDWPFESVGAVSFKGKAGKAELFRLNWTEVAKPDRDKGPRGLPRHYQLGDMISHGGTGDMYRGLNSKTSRPVCIKGLHRFLAEDPNARVAFHEAAIGMAKLAHEGIVRVIDWSDEDAEEPFFVSEYLVSRTLEQHVQEYGCPPPGYAALILYRVAQFIAYAHKQDVLHGDIKPGCVLINEYGQLRVINFGLAAVAASQVERTGATIGNPAFMAPEQVVGTACDVRSDVYSLGALLYYLLCGRSPYESAGVQVTREVTSGGFTPIKKLNPDAPDALVEVVGKSLSIVPDGRPPDIHTFASEMAKHFRSAGLDVQRDLGRFLHNGWRARSEAVTESSGSGAIAEVDAVLRESGVGEAERSAVLDAVTKKGAVPAGETRISLTVAVIGAIVIAALFFALGWKMAGERPVSAVQLGETMPAPLIEVEAPGEGEAADAADEEAEGVDVVPVPELEPEPEEEDPEPEAEEPEDPEP